MDGHGSRMTANVISVCMEKGIDILILPPHTSHVLQPLDVSVFAPLKRALAVETDALSRLDPGRLQRAEWTEMYIRARAKVLTAQNIRSGWRATCLWPLSPVEVLSRLQPSQTSQSRSRTPEPLNPLDLTLLDSSPPDGTELRRANELLRSELRKRRRCYRPLGVIRSALFTLVKWTVARTSFCASDSLTQRHFYRYVSNVGKAKSEPEDKYVYSRQEILEVAKQTERAAAAKNRRGQRQRDANASKTKHNNCQMLETVSSDSDSDCIVVATARSS